MRAALKHSAGHRSKDKPKLDVVTENCLDAKNADGEKFQSSQFLLCPFLHSSFDVPGQLLLVIAERNGSNDQSRGPFHRLQSESLNSSSTESTRGLVQKNSNIYEKMSSNNFREADDSISPWRWRDHLDEIRRPSVNKTCLSSYARYRQKNNAPETAIAIRNQSNQATTTSNRKRWEYLWTGRRPTGEVAYKFQHYSDIRRYMEQYRQDHVHRGTPSPETKNEEPFQTSTLLSICSIDAPLEQPLQDLIRPFLAAQRLPYNYNRGQTTAELYQQRKRRAKSGVSLLGFRGHLYEQDSASSVKYTVGREEDGVAGERCISSRRRALHPNGRGGVLDCAAATVVIGGISLPWCNLRLASRRDSTKHATDILMPDKRKNINDSSTKEIPTRDAVLPAAG